MVKLHDLAPVVAFRAYTLLSWDVFATPAVANGVVYVGSSDSNLYALDAITGFKLWSSHLGFGGVTSSPVVANGFVYVVSNDPSSGGDLYFLNASTGFNDGAIPLGFSTSPAAANGVVYAAAVNTVYAYNGTTGETKGLRNIN